jgi:hypothetical protein
LFLDHAGARSGKVDAGFSGQSRAHHESDRDYPFGSEIRTDRDLWLAALAPQHEGAGGGVAKLGAIGACCPFA